MNRYREAAVETAQQAGALLLDEFRAPAHGRPTLVEYKSGADLVTAADRLSEQFIVERLGTLFPSHAIVAEEGGGQGARSAYCWYVDPLDGTTNFAHGYPFFSVSLALVAGDELLVAVVHDPVRGETFEAARGEGAWLNQKRIQVSKTERLAESLLATGFPSSKRHENPNILYYHRFTLISHGVRRDGSAALDLCYVACGRFDGFWELNLQPWDVAAGTLLVREAGGVVTDFNAIPYRLGGQEIAASNGRIYPELRQVFTELAERPARLP
ncbi:MAG: inositol monophosphatase family protein [Candidatus Acidiferrales bacterium]